MIPALSCSSIGTYQYYYLIQTLLTLLKHSNKHIMIDLGTGNNNKMCVPILFHMLLMAYFRT